MIVSSSVWVYTKKEIWARLDNLSRYKFSSLGRVKNKSKIMKPKIGKCGYVTYNLKTDENKTKTFFGHKLVALAFLPNTENKPSIDHIDRNRSNNDVGNLRWATHKEQSSNIDENRKYNTGKPILMFDMSGKFIREFPSLFEATKFVDSKAIKSDANISKAALGQNFSSHGYRWEYKKPKNYINEKWKVYYQDSRNYYLVSNYGRIKNNETIINGYKNGHGYNCFNFKQKSLRVHRVVAELYIPNLNNYEIVNHKDGNPLNNKVENLEWCNRSQNAKHAIEIGLLKRVRKIAQVDDNGNILKIFNSCRDCDRFFNIWIGATSYLMNNSKSLWHDNINLKYLDELKPTKVKT